MRPEMACGVTVLVAVAAAVEVAAGVAVSVAIGVGVAVGFGVSNAEQARQAWAQGADAVVVGSAIVHKIEEFGTRAPAEVERFVRELGAAAVAGGR